MYMQKLKTFWYSFQRSLLDFTYYKDIAKSSYWFSFKYLLLLLTILSLVRAVQLGTAYSLARKDIPGYISMGRSELAKLYPKELELRISNGKLYTNVEEPYIIDFPKVFGDMEGKHMIVIDTKGVADEYPKYNSAVLATRQALVYPSKQQGDRTTTQLYYFSELKRSLYLDYSGYTKLLTNIDPLAAKLPQILDVMAVVTVILLPLFGGLFWTSGTLFGLMFLTLFVWLIEKMVKTSYGYKTLFRMGMHGATWSILFSFLLDITNQPVSYLYNLIFILWMAFVLIKNKDQIGVK